MKETSFDTAKEMKIEEKNQGNISVMIGTCKTGIFLNLRHITVYSSTSF